MRTALRAMAAEIVEDDDVARPECWHQELLDVAAEDRPVDRPVDDAGLCQRIDPESRKEREGAPASIGREAEQALALLAPAADRRHVGLDPGLVDEDEAGGIEMTARARCQRSRRRTTSGRCCSAAKSVFFERLLLRGAGSARPCHGRP